ncbi:MAG: TAXI family TRAP transporter solute-binding subunit [Bacillota bacterium]|nr:TAXI family TRAP transporter solute-binding subunit [Bacillota bacterium]
MKKFKVFLTALLILSLVFSFAACGGTEEPAGEGEGEGEAPVSYNLILATGGTSGTYYPYGGAMAAIFNANIEGMNCTAQSSGASAENLRLLNSGEADLAIVQNDVMDYAYNGIELFEGAAIDGYSAIACLYPEVVQIVARPELNVESIADLAGLRVSIGDAGSGVETNAIQILAAYGLTRDDIDARNLSFKESGSAFQDNQLDAFFVTAGVPNAAIQEICVTKEVTMISLGGDELAGLLEQYGYYTEYTIPAGTYGEAPDATAVSIMATLAVSDALDEDVVYNITKTLFEKQADLAAQHAKGAELSLEKALDGISIPLHPGAQKYYEEAGLL